MPGLCGTVALVFTVPVEDATAALFLRHLLKRLLRDRGWRCTAGEWHPATLSRRPQNGRNGDGMAPREPVEHK